MEHFFSADRLEELVLMTGLDQTGAHISITHCNYTLVALRREVGGGTSCRPGDVAMSSPCAPNVGCLDKWRGRDVTD